MMLLLTWQQNPGLSMWNGSSKIQYFIDIWAVEAMDVTFNQI